MRKRNVRHCFDFLDLENTQISLPLMVPIQRIMVRTQIFRQSLRLNDSIEHPTQYNSIHSAAVNSKADDPARKLIHHHQNPKSSQHRRFTSKQSNDHSESLAFPIKESQDGPA